MNHYCQESLEVSACTDMQYSDSHLGIQSLRPKSSQVFCRPRQKIAFTKAGENPDESVVPISSKLVVFFLEKETKRTQLKLQWACIFSLAVILNITKKHITNIDTFQQR